MEIQSDLIALPENNYLPLPWSVRGPLGLETGSEVSIALVKSIGDKAGLPDIIVSPLQSEFLGATYTVDVELGERPGAVADFLSWLGESIEVETGNKVNIVLSETITLEGRNKHKMHIVLEPAGHTPLSLNEISKVLRKIEDDHPTDIKIMLINSVYGSGPLDFLLQQKVRVDNGWIKYNGWMKKIQKMYPDASNIYDLKKVVVSSNPDQRLLRFIIPRNGVVEIRVPHQNRPGALREISNVIRDSEYNILSSRLSRTPPSPALAASTSVFVAACEPLSSSTSVEALRSKLISIDNKFMVDQVSITSGRSAERTLYLTPRRREFVSIDADIAVDKEQVREDLANSFFKRHGKRPKLFIFLSKRFISKNKHPESFREQERTIKKIVEAVEMSGCAMVEAADPGQGEEKYYDDYVYKAVFARLWASDACLVLALDENGRGNLSISIGHEIGFFAGRNRPLKVFVSRSRDQDPVFGNTVGKNRVTYPDGDSAFADDDAESLFHRVQAWIQSISIRPSDWT